MNAPPDDAGHSSGDARGPIAHLQEALGGEYEIKRELGKGTVARVFLARDRSLGRLVAIKVLLPGRAADETARKRFEREAKASASLAHPNVVEVYRFGRLPDETPYLVMRFVKGRTMEERLAAEGRLSQEKARKILAQVASALAAAHDRGIVHRDVRPGNVLWDEERGEALLSDFGIAAIMATSGQDTARLTMAGQMLGDPRYQSPEQLMGEDVTELADIYAFGVTGYELLTGEGPYEARTDQQLIVAHLQQEPRDLATLRADVDPALADLLRRCLARQPKHRPSARDVTRALEPYGAGADGAAAGASSPAGGRGAAEPADLHELVRRRVPQIVLIAIGIGWGLMTLMDQLVDRDVLPGVFYRLTLPFAACGVAAAAVVAWFHGERGKQHVTLLEYVLLGAIGVIWVTLSVWVFLAGA
jgi:serine/threonine-protein kinase